jgi:hypothetical protein
VPQPLVYKLETISGSSLLLLSLIRPMNVVASIIKKIKNSGHFSAERERLTARMNFDASYVFIAPGAKVSVASAHRMSNRGQDLLCVLRDLRFQVARPTHLLASRIEKRILPGRLLDV